MWIGFPCTMAAVHTAEWALNQLAQRLLCSHAMPICCGQQQSGQTGFLERALCCHFLVLISSSAFSLHPAAPEVPLCSLCSSEQYPPAREQCFSEMFLTSVHLWCRVTESNCFPLVTQSFWWGYHLWKISTFQLLFSLLWFPFFTYTTNQRKKRPPFFYSLEGEILILNICIVYKYILSGPTYAFWEIFYGLGQNVPLLMNF